MISSRISKGFLDTSWVLLVNVISVLTNIATFLLFANYLGPSLFGIFSYALAFGAIPAQAASLGFECVVVMNCSRDEKTLGPELGNSLLVMTTLSALCITGTYVVMNLVGVPAVTVGVVTIITASLCINSIADPLLSSTFRVMQQIRLPWLLLLLGKIAFLGAVAAVMHMKWSLQAASWLHLACNVAMCIAMLCLALAKICPSLDFGLLRRNLIAGLTFCANQLVSLARAGAPQIILERLGALAAVGEFAAAFRLANAAAIVPSALQTVFLPRFHAAKTDSQLTSWFLRIHRIIVVFAFLVAGLIFWCACDIIRLLLRGDFSQSIWVSQILAFSMVLNFASFPYSMLAEAMRKLKERLIVQAISAAVTVVACVLLTPKWGAFGAAWAAVIGWAAMFVLYQPITSPLRGRVSDMLYLPKAAIAAAVASIAAYTVFRTLHPGAFRLLAILVSYSLIYTCACLITRCITIDDVAGMRSSRQQPAREDEPLESVCSDV